MNPTATQADAASSALTPRQWSVGSAATMAIFATIFAISIANQFGNFWPDPSWLSATFVVAAMVASIATLAPPIAWPNVLLAGGLAAGIGGMAHAISAVTGFPFGQLEFTAAAGPRPLGLIPWWLPLASAVMALNARGTARFVLHRLRNHPRHGYHVILLATGLAMLTTILLNGFATNAPCYWKPGVANSLSLSSSLVLHLFIQVAVTALLIDKFPGPQPRNFRPLLVWACVNAMLLAGICLRQTS